MHTKTFFFIASVLLLLGQNTAFAQMEQEVSPITLTNPSFEDMARHSHTPIGWTDCGFAGESAPDIQPDPMGQFQVSKPAYHGATYLGMVVRDNDTWERVSQKLSRPMEAGKCYRFRLHMARSEMYVSQTRSTGTEQNYVTPAKLRIYGGFNDCDRSIMLDESDLVINYRWIEYEFRFEPDQDYSHLVFEAFYNTPTLFPYNGNVLLDNASAVELISCDEQPTEPAVVSAPTPFVQPPTPQEPTTTRAPRPQPKSDPERPEASLAGVPYSDMSVNQVIQVEGIRFDANSYVFMSESTPHLEELYEFMLRHQDVMIEIGGHTNSLAGDEYAEELSTKRALSVANYLVNKGINSGRIKTQGYGKSRQIASNKTKEGMRINQRVEVKILVKD